MQYTFFTKKSQFYCAIYIELKNQDVKCTKKQSLTLCNMYNTLYYNKVF